MPKAVSANEAKNRFGSLLGYVDKQDDEVIVESHGKPKAVIMSFSAYTEVLALREQKHRADALAQLRALRAEVRSRNQDLTEDQAAELADRFSRDLVNDLADVDVVSFERDHR
jgi:prevent-host-death family protein